MELYKKINNIAGWAVLLFATAVYTMTIESSGSFWDCGEFVPCCFKLEIPHSPGAPFFVLVGRMFTLLAMGDVKLVSVMVNFMSGLTTAFSIMFCFWSVTMLIGKFVFKNKETDYTTANISMVIAAGLIAAGCATFLDSLWFSAVEGEVYALSQFFLGFIVWAILKWEASDDAYADRWLVLIAYMVGLSIGVHLLSLLALPFISLVYYYKRSRSSNFLGLLLATAAGFVILGFAMKFVISYTQAFMSGFDKFFVNTLSMPFWSGALFYVVIWTAILAFGLIYTRQRGMRNVNLAILCGAFVYVGYLSYAIVPIRSAVNTPINMGRPTDPFSIKSYVDREQYGDRPLVYGPDYTATGQDITRVDTTGTKFYRSGNKYVYGGPKYDYKFKDEVCMLFPRMGFWNEESKKSGYRAWLSPGTRIVDRSSGETVKQFDPGQGEMANEAIKQYNQNEPNRYQLKDNISMADNIRYFFKYQFGYMYLRYFMWNFAGRQDDVQGTYGNDNGRWICGIPFIDNLHGAFFTPVMPQSNLPKSIASNKGRNKFYLIPFLLGLIGLIYTLYKDEKVFWVIFVLFVVTGLFQLVYQNEPPIEPRERDYAIAGSFWTYCFWIGFGVFAIIDFLRSKLKGMDMPVIAGVFLICLSAPYLMGSQGWDDHSRHHRYTARDFAVDYLESCAPNAILFTQGDNDTYPLWYAQEVEGIRKDIRVINLSLIGVDWYIEQLKYRWNDAPPVKITFKDEQIEGSNRDVTYYSPAANIPESASLELKKVMQFIASDQATDKVPSRNGGDMENYLPTKNIYIDVDSQRVQAMHMVNATDMGKVVPRMAWSVGGTLAKNDLITLDIVANNLWERPIYFAVSVAPDAYVGLDKYFQLEGMTYRVVPIENTSKNAQACIVNTQACFKNMTEKFKFGGIIENPDVYLDENILRMTMNLRGNYARLAQALLEQGDKERAAQALDFAMKQMPPDKVPYNFFMMSYPELYYTCGKNEKAKKLSDDLWAKAKEDIKYYQFAFRETMQKAKEDGDMGYYDQLQRGAFIQQTRPLNEQLYIMQSVMQTAKKYESPEAAANKEREFQEIQYSFVPLQQQQQQQQRAQPQAK
jgi:hypothetical protein